MANLIPVAATALRRTARGAPLPSIAASILVGLVLLALATLALRAAENPVDPGVAAPPDALALAGTVEAGFGAPLLSGS